MQIARTPVLPSPEFTIKWLIADGVQTTSSQQFLNDIEAQKRALTGLGLRPRDKVGLIGANSYLWMVSDIALVELDIVSVVFPGEFQDIPAEKLMADYGLAFLLVSDADDSETPPPRASSNIARMGRIDLSVHKLRTVENDPYPVTEDDLSFVFSSGTSGSFKGMVISKAGVIDQVNSFGDAMGFGPHDTVLLYMPFSSLQNRVLYYGAVMRGAAITAVPATQLLEGLKRFNPTVLIAPPIFYEAVEKSIKAGLRFQPLATRIFLTGADFIAAGIRTAFGDKTATTLLKKLYGKAHAAFGSRMRIMITGMAKIGPATLEFYRKLGFPLVQVYGLTECGVVCANTLYDNQIGTVGKPLAGNEITIAEDGEIVVRKAAPQTNRFFHFEASSEDTRFADDAVYTGDLGQLSPSGHLTLIGRKKSTIVAHSGVKVQPELIEKALEERDTVSKAVLVGLDSGRILGVAVQTPNSLTPSDVQALKTDVRMTVEQMAPSFKSHVQVTQTTEEFTAENGLLTRNLKINRDAVTQRFFSPSDA